jgi:hypothetical protein
LDNGPALQPNVKPDKHLKGLKCISEPPDKDLWRRRLFDIEGLEVLTENEYGIAIMLWKITHLFILRFQVYFPHVDNVYSHRSTQDYKKKPFISHYYDCRLKGRPAGTPKSDDPNKKKRKRIARERDLCDVKIKITEYLPGATRDEIANHLSQQPRSDGISADALLAKVQHTLGQTWLAGGPTEAKARFYTIQRVNGTGINAKEGDSARHRHTLEESDRIKKNSVIRATTMQEKDKKKPKVNVCTVLSCSCSMRIATRVWFKWDDRPISSYIAAFIYDTMYRLFQYSLHICCCEQNCCISQISLPSIDNIHPSFRSSI